MNEKNAAKQASFDLLRRCCRALDDKKAENIRALDVSAQSSITNFLILATGNSDTHLRALKIELERILDEGSVQIVGVDSEPGSGWTVIDAFDVMAHLFVPDMRDRYQLERLWNDAVEIPLEQLI
jgi:ribosome-associated protein